MRPFDIPTMYTIAVKRDVAKEEVGDPASVRFPDPRFTLGEGPIH